MAIVAGTLILVLQVCVAPVPDSPIRFEAGEEAGVRLDIVLAARAGLSRTVAQKLIEDGRVTVAGLPARKRDSLRDGDESPTSSTRAPSVLAAEEVPYSFVYEDDWLMVVDKPPGRRASGARQRARDPRAGPGRTRPRWARAGPA